MLTKINLAKIFNFLMEFNERINIENYSHTERRGSNSFTSVIRTVLFGMFFLGFLAFILNSSHKYIKNYQEELKIQHLRNLKDIEVDWHMEFFNQKNSQNKSAEQKIVSSLQYEKIKFNENKKHQRDNLNNDKENNNNNKNENLSLIDKETEVFISDSFFANRTLMLRNSSKIIKNNSEKDFKEIKFFLANEGNEKGSVLNSNSEVINLNPDNSNNNNNKTNYISSYYFDYINKFRKKKIQRKNNENKNSSQVDNFNYNKKKYKNSENVENEAEYILNAKKLYDSETIKIDQFSYIEKNANLKYLDYIDDFRNINNNNDIYSNEKIIRPSEDNYDKNPKSQRRLLGTLINF